MCGKAKANKVYEKQTTQSKGCREQKVKNQKLPKYTSQSLILLESKLVDNQPDAGETVALHTVIW